MTEIELITKLTADLPTDDSVLTGAGDDCAVLEIGGLKILFKTDAIVEDIHFERDTPPEQIGRKALARALSDIAAMLFIGGGLTLIFLYNFRKHAPFPQKDPRMGEVLKNQAHSLWP